MSRPRSRTPLLAGALLAALVALYFLTHRPPAAPPPPAASTSSAPSPAPQPSASADAFPAAGADAGPDAFSAALASAQAGELSQKLSDRLSRPDTRPHEAVLLFKNDDGYQRFLARAAEAGVIVVDRIEALLALRVRVRAYDTFAADLLARAADFGGVSANTHVVMPPAPAPRATGALPAVGDDLLATLGVAPATDVSPWGRGVVIAVLDSGAPPDPALGARLRYVDIGLGYAGTGAAALHASSVAAVAARLAPAAEIISIRVMDTDDRGDVFSVSRGIVAAADAGARVVNLSLGGYSTSPVLARAVAYAAARDAVVVASAGNDGAGRLVWPAADPGVVSVGATDAAGRLAPFSNAGEGLRLTAPGVGLRGSALSGDNLFSGTSASAPVVSGAIAALLSQTPGLTPAQAVDLLQTFSADGGPAGPDPCYGHGTLDLGWVLARADPGRVDTAVSGHHYNAAENAIEIVVQNRSARPASGLVLDIRLDDRAAVRHLPALAPGQSLAVPVPAPDAASVVLRTRLDNPEGVTDAVPANNTRASVLTLPGR